MMSPAIDPTAHEAQYTRDLESIAERLRRPTVQVTGHGFGRGSGVVWSREGSIITNAHVLAGRQAQVELYDGQRLEAEVVKRDEQRDLALLQVEASGLPAAEVGDSNTLRVGEMVLAVGNPLGHTGAVTLGIVHSLRRGWIQADVRLAPGNSGGPLANAEGQVIGINSMIVNGVAFAIPVKDVKAFVEGETAQTSLGLTVRPVMLFGSSGPGLGLLVVGIQKGGAAEKHGFLQGDVITRAGGSRLIIPGDLRRLIQGAAAEGIEIEYVRGGKVGTITVRQASKQETAEAA